MSYFLPGKRDSWIENLALSITRSKSQVGLSVVGDPQQTKEGLLWVDQQETLSTMRLFEPLL